MELTAYGPRPAGHAQRIGQHGSDSSSLALTVRGNEVCVYAVALEREEDGSVPRDELKLHSGGSGIPLTVKGFHTSEG